jgi:dipeptidase E
VSRTILAMGGGGFTMEPDNTALDDYILSLGGRREPRVCFLPTASGDTEKHIGQFHAAFGGRACEASHLSLFRLGSRPVPIRDTILSQDVVYVGGGSMHNMLAIWRVHGLDRILAEAWDRGVVLAGLSAGAMCWFEQGVTKSTGAPGRAAGLGLLSGSLSVHRDGEPERLPYYRAAVDRGEMPGGWAVDDGAALLFRDQGVTRVVASTAGRGAARIDPGVEVEMEADVLGTRPGDIARTPVDISEYRLHRRAGHGRR